ncbi:MAG: SPOR domain-containing protein [Pseudomonadales bacterium]
MAHDYAKRPRNGRKRKNKGISSGPIWLVTGLLCGFFLAFLLQLGGVNLVPSSAAPTERVPTPIADSPVNSGDQTQTQTTKKPRFEFYSLLPEAEVEVADQQEVPVVESSSNTATQSHSQTAPLTSARPTANGTQYVLQAGSFRRHNDADRRRAELLLMGLRANIEKVDLSPSDSRHRVYAGPFDTHSTMLDARKQLAQAKIDTLILKRRLR